MGVADYPSWLENICTKHAWQADFAEEIHKLAPVIEKLYAKCPYHVHRESMGSPVINKEGPAYEDQWAASALAHASGIRTKTKGPIRPRSLLPVYLEADIHVNLAQQVQTPFESALPLPPDLAFACDMIASESYASWAMKQRHFLQRILGSSSSDSVVSMHSFFDKFHHADCRTVAPDVKPGLIEILRRSLHWPDEYLSWMCAVGAPIIGPCAPTGIYRESFIMPTKSTQQWLQEAP